jgi:hypothetical protein
MLKAMFFVVDGLIRLLELMNLVSLSTLNYPSAIFIDRLTNQTPDYEQNMNNAHIRYIRCPQRWIRNEHRLSQIDNIDWSFIN